MASSVYAGPPALAYGVLKDTFEYVVEKIVFARMTASKVEGQKEEHQPPVPNHLAEEEGSLVVSIQV